MSSLSPEIIDAVRANDDVNRLIETFNKLYANTVYPPIEEMQTYLLVASVEFKHRALTEMLLTLKYPVNYKFGYASPSPLHAAVNANDVKLIRLLLENGSSVNLRSRATVAPSDKVYSAVEFALIADNADVLEVIQSHNDTGNQTGLPLLHSACLHGANNCVQRLLSFDEHKRTINTIASATGRCGTPLMFAVRHSSGLVRLLVDNGASASVTTVDYRSTALHMAASRDPPGKFPCGFPPVDLPDIVGILIEAGSDVNAVSLSGETALSLMCGHVTCEVNASRASADQLPYGVDVHRKIILQTIQILLDAGARADGFGALTLPLGVLSQQVQTTLGLVAQSAVDLSGGAELALATCLELFQMLISRCCNGTFNGWQPHLVVINIIDMLRQCCQSPPSVVENVVDITTDVIRILLLCTEFDASLFLPVLVTIFQWLDFGCTQFIPLLEMTSMFVSEKEFYHIKRQHTQPTSAACNLQVDADRPRSLLQRSRSVVLACFRPADRINSVKKLYLPARMKDYLLFSEYQKRQ